jgi:hypothetical protein
MPIKLDCPRCQRPLAVPAKFAGSYSVCPLCQSRFWVPELAASGAAPLPAPPASTDVVPPGAVVPAPATPPPRKVARFIPSEAADSALKLADDGKLPELRLGDVPDSSVKEKKGSGTNPLLLFGLLSLSVVSSLVLLLAPDSSTDGSQSADKLKARQIIAEQYFSDLDQVPREPYQILLREARLAYSRGDLEEERRSAIEYWNSNWSCC